jgi:2-methylisocitrate lyase-like PEP mutase family enzyme
VLYAPGPKTPEQIATIVAAAGGKPVNQLIYGDFGLSVSDIAGLGARRISIGGALARAAWAAFIEATRLIKEEGSFKGFAGNGPSSPLNPFFRDDLKARS